MLTSPRLRSAFAPSIGLAWLALPAALAIPPAATAAEAPAVQLRVDASPDCTTREELAARVAARTSRITFTAPDGGSPAVAVRVAITATPRAVLGDLTITQAGSPAAARRISAPSCEQLTDALALVIALAFDPDTTAASVPGQPATPPVAPRAGENAPPLQAAPAPASAPARPQEPPPAVHRRASAAVGPQVLIGPAPRAMPGLTLDLSAGWDRPSVWSPAVRLSAGLAWSGALSEPGGTAGFSMAAITLDACPVRLASRNAELRTCATGTLGRLGAAGSRTFDATTVERPFAATGGALVVTLPVGQRVEITARGSVAASWIRDSFAFAPAVFYRGAPLLVTAGLTAGVPFR
jgi:hypothetical protein